MSHIHDTSTNVQFHMAIRANDATVKTLATDYNLIPEYLCQENESLWPLYENGGVVPHGTCVVLPAPHPHASTFYVTYPSKYSLSEIQELVMTHTTALVRWNRDTPIRPPFDDAWSVMRSAKKTVVLNNEMSLLNVLKQYPVDLEACAKRKQTFIALRRGTRRDSFKFHKVIDSSGKNSRVALGTSKHETSNEPAGNKCPLHLLMVPEGTSLPLRTTNTTQERPDCSRFIDVLDDEFQVSDGPLTHDGVQYQLYKISPTSSSYYMVDVSPWVKGVYTKIPQGDTFLTATSVIHDVHRVIVDEVPVAPQRMKNPLSSTTSGVRKKGRPSLRRASSPINYLANMSIEDMLSIVDKIPCEAGCPVSTGNQSTSNVSFPTIDNQYSSESLSDPETA